MSQEDSPYFTNWCHRLGLCRHLSLLLLTLRHQTGLHLPNCQALSLASTATLPHSFATFAPSIAKSTFHFLKCTISQLTSLCFCWCFIRGSFLPLRAPPEHLLRTQLEHHLLCERFLVLASRVLRTHPFLCGLSHSVRHCNFTALTCFIFAIPCWINNPLAVPFCIQSAMQLLLGIMLWRYSNRISHYLFPFHWLLRSILSMKYLDWCPRYEECQWLSGTLVLPPPRLTRATQTVLVNANITWNYKIREGTWL